MPALSIGTVTFLGTAIENHLAQADLPAAGLLASRDQYQAIIRSSIDAHGGTIFQIDRDSSCSAFVDASSALAAALDLQHAVQAAPEEGALLSVRIALHSGSAGAYDGTYFGATLTRTDYLLAAGQAGQILLSHTTRDLVGEHLPAGAVVRELGHYRLKDLGRPEPICQLAAPDLPSAFPPLHTLDAYPNNLPVQTTPFLGREHEIAAACELLRRADIRLLSMIAPSGSGKTRFSLQVAADLIADFRDGIYFVALAPVSDPALVVATIAQTLGVKEIADQPLLETLTTYLCDRQVLLVLDNFEQVLEAAQFIDALLAGTQQIKIIITSHLPLRIAHEQIVQVPPLKLPDPTSRLTVETLIQYPATALFVERAQAARSDFTLMSQQVPAVARLCICLGGLPLAIELVAAHSDALSPEDMLEQLVGRHILLGDATATPLVQVLSLRQVLDWSYGRLDAHAQRLFARLGVFVGGCILEAVEVVCNAEDDLELDVLNDMKLLLDKNLLLQEELTNDEPRYIMLDCVHEYAQDRLRKQGEIEALHRRHAAYYRDLAEIADPELRGPHQEAWMRRLEGEQYNLRAVLGWALECREREIAVGISGSIWRFWLLRNQLSEGVRWLDAALANSRDVSTAMRTKALNGASVLGFLQGNYQRAKTLSEESLSLYRKLRDKRGMAVTLQNLGNMALLQGDTAGAKPLYEASLTLRQELGDTQGTAALLNNLGCLTLRLGEYIEAQRLLTESLRLARELGTTEQIIDALGGLGWLALAQEDHQDATLRFTEGLELCRALGGHGEVLTLIEGFAGAIGAQGQSVGAARLFGAAEAGRETIGSQMPLDERDRYHRIVAAAHTRFDAETFAMAWTAGRSMSVEQAIAYAINGAYYLPAHK